MRHRAPGTVGHMAQGTQLRILGYRVAVKDCEL